MPATGRQRHTTYKFDDRGRGPQLDIVNRYDERGMLLSYQLDGLNYAKRPLNDLELFAAASSWQSLIRTGFETTLPELLAEQDKTLSAERTALARGSSSKAGLSMTERR